MRLRPSAMPNATRHAHCFVRRRIDLKRQSKEDGLSFSYAELFVKCERRRQLALRRLWRARARPAAAPRRRHLLLPSPSAPAASLPLLQVWPSAESPPADVEGQGLVAVSSPASPPDDLAADRDDAAGGGNRRRGGGGLLHPEHARLMRQSRLEEPALALAPAPAPRLSPASSTASSLGSERPRHDLMPEMLDDRRRSSTLTARYSLFDALDLEYALLRAAARGSVGPYSLSESLHKLTFTQSLAFPALARGMATKRGRARTPHSRPCTTTEPALNIFAEILTTLVLVLVSVLVFGLVYKFVRP
ncbi:hypothetical protein EVAR_12072_1 [Eumeta japonica]|uniref:Uncharacterized protein n=1 Tax=Eumeta variegata TaxID=151549 RepID=A0A4C1U572_EUMVA|nr:hypothetical protein EVAR_12072_1 [Eumeta japonica]